MYTKCFRAFCNKIFNYAELFLTNGGLFWQYCFWSNRSPIIKYNDNYWLFDIFHVFYTICDQYPNGQSVQIQIPVLNNPFLNPLKRLPRNSQCFCLLLWYVENILHDFFLICELLSLFHIQFLLINIIVYFIQNKYQ